MSDSPQGRALRDAAAVEPAGDGRYDAMISGFYTTVSDHPNGGYLQCVMANAALAAATLEGARQIHATSITTNFISAPRLGPARLQVVVRRVGRSVSFVHVTLSQDGVVNTESLITLGTLRDDTEVHYADVEPPHIATLAECRRSTGGDDLNIMRVLDLRLDPATAGWNQGVVRERGEVRGWLRMDDGGGPWNAGSLLFASDALPPATFPLGSSGWVPTLQLTSYVRRLPTSEWLHARQWCVVIADGIVDERCELFDDRGELVASSSQVAMVRFPAGR